MDARDRVRVTSDAREAAPAALAIAAAPVARVLALQRSAGNHAVATALRAQQPMIGRVTDAEYGTLSTDELAALEGPVLVHLAGLMANTQDPDFALLAAVHFKPKLLGILKAKCKTVEQLRFVIAHFERAARAERTAGTTPGNEAAAVRTSVEKTLRESATVPGDVKGRLGDAAGKGSALEGAISVHGMFDFAMAGADYAKRTRPLEFGAFPTELVAVFVEIDNLMQGTEAFAETVPAPRLHLRSGRTGLHIALHESMHALAAPGWNAASWPPEIEAHRYLHEGTTELLTAQVLDDANQGQTVKAYDAEKVRVDQLRRANGISMSELADLYFHGTPVALAQRLGLKSAALAGSAPATA